MPLPQWILQNLSATSFAAIGVITVSGSFGSQYTSAVVPERLTFRFMAGDLAYDLLLREVEVVGVRKTKNQTFYRVKTDGQEWEMRDGLLYTLDEAKARRLLFLTDQNTLNASQIDSLEGITPSPDPDAGILTTSYQDISPLAALRKKLSERLAALAVTPAADPAAGLLLLTFKPDGEERINKLNTLRKHAVSMLSALEDM